ncbi:MAG: MaoC family dehydratase [Deltaproteobacteria bacterium]|nr:MAG: MaoC family dehydratase [Deltaproteobacteria bacterium]
MANKGWTGNFFEDFELGRRRRCAVPRRLTDGDVSAYIALTGDRTPGYCGGEPRVHPLITFHLVLGQTVRSISLNARANLGYADMRWGVPVVVGDTIRTEIEVVGLKENSSGTTGIAWVRTEALNQRDETVLSYTRWVMVKKRGSEATRWLEEPVVPTLPKAVAPESLSLASVEAMPSPEVSGAEWAFEDYEEGERIWHHDGMTVNPSDHMAFTRLFQNTAKVHFDALLTEGRPLVYGGVPVSVAYAQALNGLDNRVGIVGLNGGAHANPVHAGDTLYSFTEVVGKARTADPRVGALRLRMFAVKNEDPLAIERGGGFHPLEDDPRKPGRQRHRSSVVLDLDFWELMPTRAGLTGR